MTTGLIVVGCLLVGLVTLAGELRTGLSAWARGAILGLFPLMAFLLAATILAVSTSQGDVFLCDRGALGDRVVCSRADHVRQSVILFGVSALPALYATMLMTLSVVRFTGVARELRRRHRSSGDEAQASAGGV